MPYSYAGSPEERVQQARYRISGTEGAASSSALASYMALAEQASVQPQEQAGGREASFFDKAGDTLGDIVHNVFKGTQKAVEGILDFGATIVGEIAGAVGDEKTKQGAADFIARDLTGEYESEIDMRSHQILGKSLFADSAVNEMSDTGQAIVRGVAQGVGQMAPMIVSGYVAGAAGAGALATQAATYAPLFGSAFGNATESALNDTDIYDENGNVIGKRNVSLDRAALYGLASGALEVATESLVGGIWSTGAKGVLDPVVSRLASSVRFGNAVKFIADAVGEGVEEVVGAAFENTLKTIYKNENGHMSWENPDIQDMIVSGVIGSLTAAVMNGGNVATRKVSTTAYVGDKLATVSEMDSRADTLAAEGKLTEKQSAALAKERTRAMDQLINRYTNANEKTRAKLWSTYEDQLKAYINQDGTPVETKLNDGAKAIETGDSAVISPSLKSRANGIANTLASQQSTLASNLNETETDVIRSLQKAGRAVGSKLGLGGLKFVVFDGTDNGFIDKDVVYINRKRLSDMNSAAKTFAHEAWHFSEGSIEHKALYEQLLKMTDRETGKTLLQLAVEDVRKSTASAIGEGGYPISEEVLAEIENGDLTYDDLFGAKGSERGLAVAEIGAHMAEHLLTNQEMIDDLARSDRSTARKVLDRIKDTIEALKAWLGGDAESYQAYKDMVKARKMFEDALAKAGQMTALPKAKDARKNDVEHIKYSIMNSRSFADNVKSIIAMDDADANNNIAAGNFVSVMKNTPSIILEKVDGAKDLEVIMPFEKLYCSVRRSGVSTGHYHNLGNIALNLPEYISDPLAIVTLQNGRINLLAEMQTEKGNGGVISVELNAIKDINDKYEAYNLIITAFSADDNYIKNLAKKVDKVNYKKEDLSQVNETTLKWLNIINERPLSYSIADDRPNVNTEPKKSINPDAKPSKASKKRTTAQLAEDYHNLEIAGADLRYYTKADAKKVYASVMSLLTADVKDGQIYGKAMNKKAIIDALYMTLNEAEEGGRYIAAQGIADYIISVALAEDSRLEAEHQADLDLISAGKRYLHGIKWSDKLAEEARHKFDTRYPAIKKAWAAEDGGINHDEFVDTLSSDTGEVFGLDSDDEYAVIEFIDKYYKAMDRAVKAKHTKLVDAVGKKQLGAIREEISRTIYDAYKTYGRSAAPIKRMIENAVKAVDLASLETQEALQAAADATANADKRIAEMEQRLKDTVKELRNENTMVNRCLDDAKRLAALSAEERGKPVGPGVTGYHSATVLTNPHVSALMSELASVRTRGLVRGPNSRRIIEHFGKFYTKDNELLQGIYDEDIRADVDLLLANVKSKDKLSIEELTALHHVLKHVEHLAANMDRVSFRGKTKSITDTSKTAQKEINDFAEFNVKRNTGLRQYLNKYANYISEPRVVLEALVGYKKDAELMQLFDDLTIGETGYNSMLARMSRIWIDFQRQNKSYIKRLAKEKVTIGGDTITKGEAVYLAMLCLQEDSRTKLQNSGYYTYDKTRSIKHEALSDGDINELMNSLTAQDRDLMDAARKVYDYATDAHIKTDKDLHGFSDIEDNPNPYYVHEMVAGENLPSTADNNGGSANASAANVGLSKKRRGSKLSLAVTDIFDALQVFAEDEAKYCNMAVPAKNFELVYNRNTSLTPEGKMDATNVKSIHTAVASAWGAGDKYITKWLQDVQGFTNKSYDPMRKLANRVYSNFVTASLGMNIKVVFSQFASYPAAAMYINPISMMRAMVTGYGKGNLANLDKYSDWAFARNATNGAVVALSLQDKMSKFVELTTKGISAMDRITIGRIWTACQIEVERSQGLKRGTEANLKAAAEMLEDVGRRTQPNYTQSERSALQRGDNIISMLAKPFTSVATKYASRLIEAVGALQAANYAKKNGIETTISQAAAAKQLARTAASLAAANAMFAMIVEFVKHILNKDRKEKKDGTEMTVWEDLLAEFASASVGMLPVVNDLYEQIFSWAVQGKRYSTGDNFATSAFNDVLDSTFALGNLAETMFSGKEVDSEKVNAALKKSIIAIGKAFGLPMSNTYNLAYGLVKRFDEGAAYEWDVRFGSSSYQKDLKKAIQEGNDDLADTIFSLMVSDKGISGVSSSVNSYLRDLYGKYAEDQAKAADEREGIVNFLPKAANGSFSWNCTTITLTAAEQKKFTAVYAEASKAVEALIAGDGFKSLSSSTQASAVKTIFDYYYDRAKYTVMDQEFDSKKMLFGDAMGIEKLSLAAASAAEFRAGLSDKLNDAAKRVRLVNYLVRLGLTARERAMVLAYMGYGVSDYRGILLSTARQLGYTGDQLKAWKNACGIA